MEGDLDLELLRARKLLELKKRLAKQTTSAPEAPKEPSAREVVANRLVERGDEVLAAAEAAYPRQTAEILDKIADLIKRQVVKDPISGGELLQVFRSLGLRVSIPTFIAVARKGKRVLLSDQLKASREAD